MRNFLKVFIMVCMVFAAIGSQEQISYVGHTYATNYVTGPTKLSSISVALDSVTVAKGNLVNYGDLLSGDIRVNGDSTYNIIFNFGTHPGSGVTITDTMTRLVRGSASYSLMVGINDTCGIFTLSDTAGTHTVVLHQHNFTNTFNYGFRIKRGPSAAARSNRYVANEVDAVRVFRQ